MKTPKPSIPELLTAVKNTTNLDPKFSGTTDTIKAFSELLVALSEKADEQAIKNLSLGQSVRNLTWYILGLTVVMIFLGAGQFFFSYKSVKIAEKAQASAYNPSTSPQ